MFTSNPVRACCFLLASLALHAKAADTVHVTGTVIELNSQAIELRLPGGLNAKATPIPIGLGFMPSVEIDDVDDRGVFERSAGINDLRMGQQITATVENGYAVKLRIRQQLTTQGLLQQIEANNIKILTGAAAKQIVLLSIDRAHLRVTGELFDGGPKVILRASDLQPGRMVSVINARGQAYTVDVAPLPAVSGRVEAVVESSRVMLSRGEPSFADHLARYYDIDIALDTYPYNGTTTICEALWMGVPVVSRSGNSHRSRVGRSIPRTVGLEDLASDDAESFRKGAIALAGDEARRRRIRGEIRQRMAASAVMKPARFRTCLHKTFAGLD